MTSEIPAAFKNITVTSKDRNMIQIIHRLVTDEYGENYWFDGCARYIMECLNEPDFDYDFFAGLWRRICTILSLWKF